jgi:hypothetical protein
LETKKKRALCRNLRVFWIKGFFVIFGIVELKLVHNFGQKLLIEKGKKKIKELCDISVDRYLILSNGSFYHSPLHQMLLLLLIVGICLSVFIFSSYSSNMSKAF